VIALALAACHGPDEPADSGPLLDTGWFTDTSPPDTDVTTCADQVTGTDPADGSADFYWRDPLHVKTTSTESTAYTAVLNDGSARPVAAHVVWDDVPPGFDLVPEVPLTPSTAYTLTVSDCRTSTTVAFTTSAYGLPLSAGPTSLIRGTWRFDLTEATWEQPSGFGALLALYFDTPILLGVQWADERTLDLIGAQGYEGGTGLVQDTSQPTWDFPLASFEQSPYFAGQSSVVAIEAAGVQIDIHDFTLDGTFAADGSSIGGTRVTGLGDTRYLGPALNLGDSPSAVCDIAAGMGADCEQCPDGEPYCLALLATHLEGVRVDDLVIRRIDP
jgi:hypothetical protein